MQISCCQSQTRQTGLNLRGEIGLIQFTAHFERLTVGLCCSNTCAQFCQCMPQRGQGISLGSTVADIFGYLEGLSTDFTGGFVLSQAMKAQGAIGQHQALTLWIVDSTQHTQSWLKILLSAIQIAHVQVNETEVRQGKAFDPLVADLVQNCDSLLQILPGCAIVTLLASHLPQIVEYGAFTLAVANIGPGEIVAVHLEYNEELAFTDGEFLMRLPLTFTPRFIPYTPPEFSPADPPGGCVPEDVDDAERISPPFLPTHDERGMRARIQVRIQAGFPLETLECPSHPVLIRQEGPCWDVRPASGSVRADRDFLLRWRPQPGRQMQASLFVEAYEEQQYGLLLLIPPIATSQAGRGLPTETLFVIDVSGSMKGPSIKQAREALLAALDRLRDGDRFNILRFSNDSDVYRHVFQSANDPQTMREAQRWVRDLNAGGGTRILPALQRAIAMTGAASDGHQQRIVLLTDAAIGNERGVFDAVHRGLGHARLHVVGIGRAPNSYFTRRLARIGRGLCTFVADVDGAENEMDAFLERIHRPVMTGLEISLNDRPLTEPYPDPLPDLYAGEPLVLSFRLPDGLARENLSASLQGHAATGEFHLTLSVTVNAERSAGVARRWARAKIAEHMDQLHEGADPERVRRDVIALATRFHLVTSYTSFVAVETTPTVSGTARTLRMPNTLPSGSHLMGLPRGGSRGPLTCLVGLVCTCLALAILLLVWRSAPRPVS